MGQKKILCFLLVFPCLLFGNNEWPLKIKTKSGGLITVYQPQPESLQGNKLSGRAAFSAQAKSSDDLLFGVFWYNATISTNRDTRMSSLESILVKEIKLPGIEDTSKISLLKTFLEIEIPKSKINLSIEEITSTIEQDDILSSKDLKNEAPDIIYKTEATLLVLMDGEPKLEDDKNLQMKRIINTAFLIVQNPDDKKYYLYAGDYWYVSGFMKEDYKHVDKLPKRIASLDQQIKTQTKSSNTGSAGTSTNFPAILILTSPTEIIQSRGAAEYASIEGTGLLYVSNSEDDIFKNISDQKFYVLISGRWYTSLTLDGKWVYLPADQLPADFSKIPEGSAKDIVLASVPGTKASKEAIMDAQVPQTAKVDRATASCTVTYDGEPKFEKIEGTSLELAMNTSKTVVRSGTKYYCVDNGVWFVASQATGPWKVSDERPQEVDKIPASSPAYNVQYVYIYDSTPDVVYVGYTPGYMGCYVYGPTVVYGTGYYYNPWYGPYYYPHPATYGYSMHYNPYMGWSMGFHYSTGCFTFSMYGHPGYWGPPMYHPPYHPPYHGGMYGARGPVYVNNSKNININNSNNIYNKQNGVNTNDVKRGQNTNRGSASTMDQKNRAQAQPTDKAGMGGKNNVYAGKDGNVYQQNDKGGMNQRSGNDWKSTQQPSNMNKDVQNRERSQQKNSGYDQMNRGGNMGGGRAGGATPRGGSGGGRRR